MKLKKHLSPIAIIIAYLFIMSPAIADTLAVDTYAERQKVKFYNLRVSDEKQQTIVTGKLKRRIHNSKVKPGYIAYELKNVDGQTLLTGRTTYSPSLSLRKWEHGSQFQIKLPNELPQGSRIALFWKSR